jgi:hypothetical protein
VSGFTPGPWSVSKGSPQLVGCEGFWIASTMGIQGDEGEANARLIAAAPEMLAALQKLIPTNLCTTNANIGDDAFIPFDMTMGEIRNIAAVVAKATGQSVVQSDNGGGV